jgi:type II secretory pathway pseudopilin PulG
MRQLNRDSKSGYLVLEAIIAVIIVSVASVSLYSLIQSQSQSSAEATDFLIAISGLSKREKEYRYLTEKPKLFEESNGYVYKLSPRTNANGTKTLISTVTTKFGNRYRLTTFVSDIMGGKK